MRIFAVTACLLVLLGSAAAAQNGGDVIRIKKDDGSVEVFQIPAAPAAPEPAAPFEVKAPAVAEPSAPVKPVVKKDAVKKTVKKPVRKERIKEKPVKKPESKILKEAQRPIPRPLPPNAVITPELAKSIALDHAPPARSMEVAQRVYQGKPVFVVTFKTETGLFDVLVDAQTGKVVTTVSK